MRPICINGKPHLRIRFGVWSCVSFGPDRTFTGFRAGFGNSWADAWADWKQRSGCALSAAQSKGEGA